MELLNWIGEHPILSIVIILILGAVLDDIFTVIFYGHKE